jgi:hypothetical protein
MISSAFLSSLLGCVPMLSFALLLVSAEVGLPPHINHSTHLRSDLIRLYGRTTVMANNRRQTPRKPATKFAHLQKKMQKQKTQVKRPRSKR